jgi:hypothetical protein
MGGRALFFQRFCSVAVHSLSQEGTLPSLTLSADKLVGVAKNPSLLGKPTRIVLLCVPLQREDWLCHVFILLGIL